MERVIVVCFLALVLSVSPAKAIDCVSLIAGLLPCKNYLSNFGAVTPSLQCCDSATALIDQADTDGLCQCLRQNSLSSSILPSKAQQLPNLCNIPSFLPLAKCLLPPSNSISEKISIPPLFPGSPLLPLPPLIPGSPLTPLPPLIPGSGSPHFPLPPFPFPFPGSGSPLFPLPPFPGSGSPLFPLPPFPGSGSPLFPLPPFPGSGSPLFPLPPFPGSGSPLFPFPPLIPGFGSPLIPRPPSVPGSSSKTIYHIPTTPRGTVHLPPMSPGIEGPVRRVPSPPKA